MELYSAVSSQCSRPIGRLGAYLCAPGSLVDSAEQHLHLLELSVGACGPRRAQCERPSRGPRWAGPVDSSLALLSQQEDISWSNSESLDEGRLVSSENGVGED
ncbi:unnamed protein product [Pleuronectes platessa]|uniref:Uncharacterized protein n=1 Tax=Pleuronectes platessa TaxID=8262 RepID=A0A9N7W047_PLEPL|nr:unnamed protein product [Pleuronectes platessa]